MLLTQPTLANAVGPIVFVIVVVGGLGSLAGAFIASMLIGILQTFAVAIDYSLADLLRSLGFVVTRATPAYEFLAIKIATAAPIVPYLLLVIILIVRPMDGRRVQRVNSDRSAHTCKHLSATEAAHGRRAGRRK